MFILMAGTCCLAQPTGLEGSLSSRRTAEIEASLAYLLRSAGARDYFSVSDSGISLYASPLAKRRGEAEFHLFPGEYEAFSTLARMLPPERLEKMYEEKGVRPWPRAFVDKYGGVPTWRRQTAARLPLEGLRIALDPGHVAGSMEEAILEGKAVRIRPHPRTGPTPIAFYEADLTLATAHLLKERFEEMGATVMMTRTRSGVSALGYSYETWKSRYMANYLKTSVKDGQMNARTAQRWQNGASEADLYRRLFTPKDLEARARKINLFQPHLTLIIHYNVDVDNWNQREPGEYFTPGEKNYCMAFVPGSFTGPALADRSRRLDFLRILVSGDTQRSVQLSEAFVRASEKVTGVPVVAPDAGLVYLDQSSRPTPAAGVYARNLLLTRLVKGPLCYGESLCQDHWQEGQYFGNKDLEIEGIRVSSRVRDVAEAYYQAVMNYLEFYD